VRNSLLIQTCRTMGCIIFMCPFAGFAQQDALESLMRTHGLSEYDLTQLPMRQFFDSPYVVAKREGDVEVSWSFRIRILSQYMN
jgi:hypothetical protein